MIKRRALGKSGLLVSEVGLGCEHLQGLPLEVVQDVIDAALAQDMNILDVFMSEPEVRTNIGTALRGRREDVVLQGHIGAGWKDGQYFRTREPGAYRFHFEDFMRRIGTDYVDIGMLHFVDTQADVDAVLESGMLEYAADLKEKGTIRAVGVSSHDPVAAGRMVDTGGIDVLMFSVNPAYDLLPPDTDIDGLFKAESYASQAAFAITPERLSLYQRCEARGVGITVMKALGGGALLNARQSPYEKAMTVPQCIHYALSRPGVASVLVGCKSPEEVEAAAAYADTPPEGKDYAPVLAQAPKFSMRGQCVYCNHCLPCPAQIDIAQVNKYLDLSGLSTTMPETVRAHYGALPHKAGACTACGACEVRCPFGVEVIRRMRQAAEVFGA